MDLGHMQDFVVRPALERVGYWSQSAEELVLGTGLQESNYRYLRQLGGGPAVGCWQIEPNTARDLWGWMASTDKAHLVAPLLVPGEDKIDQLSWNLLYAAALCRMYYRRIPEPLPDAGDVRGQARYWKRFYNTSLGKGTELAYRKAWARYH
jgi:hypothetical protein